MKNTLYNIVKIATFIVAIIDVLLAIIFAYFRFGQDRVDKYNEIVCIKENNPQMLAAFDATSIEDLPAFVNQYRSEKDSISGILKANQLQKNILYTFYMELNELENEAMFTQYKDNFENHAKGLFAKSDNAQAYIDGFNGVANFEQLANYKQSLATQYNKIKQDFLEQKKYERAYNSFVNQVDQIDQIVSVDKKTADLASLKADVKKDKSNTSILNTIMYLSYALFFFALLSALYFAVKSIVIKGSFKTLIYLGIFAVIILLCFMVATTWIEAMMYIVYVAFIGTVCAVAYDVVSRLIGRQIK